MRLRRIHLGFAVGLAVLACSERATAAGVDAQPAGAARDARMEGARSRLATTTRPIDYRVGCVSYVYGCGYGSVSQDRSANAGRRQNKTRW